MKKLLREVINKVLIARFNVLNLTAWKFHSFDHIYTPSLKAMLCYIGIEVAGERRTFHERRNPAACGVYARGSAVCAEPCDCRADRAHGRGDRATQDARHCEGGL